MSSQRADVAQFFLQNARTGEFDSDWHASREAALRHIDRCGLTGWMIVELTAEQQAEVFSVQSPETAMAREMFDWATDHSARVAQAERHDASLGVDKRHWMARPDTVIGGEESFR